MVGGREVPLNLVLCDETNTALPLRRRVVEDVEHLEPVLMTLRELVQLGTQQNVLDADVSVDEGELGAVERVLERCADDLQHGRDACSASNHPDLVS